MRFIFADTDRASRAARDISRHLRERGIDAPFTRCQHAVARATGYASWSELVTVSRAAVAPSSLDRDVAPAVATARRTALQDALRAIPGVTDAMARESASLFAPTGSRPPRTEVAVVEKLTPQTLDELLEGVASDRPDPELAAWLAMEPVGREWGAPGWEELIGVPPAQEAAYVGAMALRFGIAPPALRPQGGYGPVLEAMARAVKSKGLDWDTASRAVLAGLTGGPETVAMTLDGEVLPSAVPFVGAGRRVWTEEERQIVRLNWTTPDAAERIGRMLGRSPSAVSLVATRMGLAPVMLEQGYVIDSTATEVGEGLYLLAHPTGKGKTTEMVGLVAAALRHAPERTIVGEVRSPEAFDLLQAANGQASVPPEVSVLVMKWREIEVGWGDRPDGYSIHASGDACKAWIQAYWDGMPDRRPSEYEAPGWQDPISVAVPGNHPLALALAAGTVRIQQHEPLRRTVEEALEAGMETRPARRM